MRSPRLPSLRHLAAPATTLATAAVLSAAALVGAVSPAGAALDPDVYFWDESDDAISVGGTYTPIVGDFGGNGLHLDDIIWYAPGATVDHIWLSDGDTTFTKQELSPQIGGTYVPLVGDFAGDSKDDIFWYGPGATPDSLWVSAGEGTFAPTPVTQVNGTYAPKVLDDGAGKDDIIWVGANGGAGSIWSSEGGGVFLSTPFVAPAGSRPIVGRFNGGACADVFWYGPGAAGDVLWHLNCAGTAGSVVPQSVFGTYTPVVEDFSADGDDEDDIFWYRAHEASSLWQSDGDGTWTSSSHTIPLAGTPLPAAKSWGLVHIWSPTQQNVIFWDVLGPDDFVARSLNTHVGSGYTPIVGDFVGFEADIFFYKPGSAPERLYYENA